METYHLTHFPPNVGTVHVAYFEHVRNAPEIRRRLVAAARADGDEGERARAEMDFAFVDAALIVSKQHLMTGILSALLTSMPPVATATLPAPPTPKTSTHNLHSEVLLALNPNNNITDAIRRHGVGDATTRLVVVRFSDGSASEADVWASIGKVVEGELVAVGALDEVDKPDWGRIDKVYKLGEMNQLKVPDVREAKIAAVVNTVAIKHAT